MPNVEEVVIAQYERIFVQRDWKLFKQIAEFHLKRAVFLRMSDLTEVPRQLRRLARNIDKRLRIGLGTELLLKAVYLKHGFSINLPKKKAAGTPPFPFSFQQIQGIAQAANRTYTLHPLIQHLSSISAVGQLGRDERGLRIAKVFRNKEGHAVFGKHAFDPTNYRDIEAALTALYSKGFKQSLQVRFSVKSGEKGLWRVRE